MFSKPCGPYASIDEQRAFKYYCEGVVGLTSRYSDPYIWSTLVPQAAWSHRALRDALIALSVVYEKMRLADRVPGIAYGHETLPYLNSAFRSISVDQPPVHVVLMTGLLLQFLETLNKNLEATLFHLRSSIRILDECKQKFASNESYTDEEKDIILNYLAPEFELAKKFADSNTQKSDRSKRAIVDHISVEGFEFRKQMSRSGIVDAFRDTMDARCNLGSIAVKTAEVRLRLLPEYGAFLRRDVSSQTGFSKKIHKVTRMLPHFCRLFKPMWTPNSLVDRMLWIHYKTIKMMLLDILPPGLEYEELLGLDAEPLNYDSITNEIETLVSTPSIQAEPNFCIELGLIPPLFYLATAAHRNIPISLRNQAITLLQSPLGNRLEGAWTGSMAAKVAIQQIALESRFGSGSIISNIKLETFENAILTMQTPASIPSDDSNSPKQPPRELWVSFSVRQQPKYTPPIQDAESSNFQPQGSDTQWYKCGDIWTADEIDHLPPTINGLIRTYGYQGYFHAARTQPATDDSHLSLR